MANQKKTSYSEFYLERDKTGRVSIVTDIADRAIDLSPVVAEILWPTLERVIELQTELDKIDAVSREKFPVELARGVVHGLGFFKHVGPAVMLGQQLNGIFGETRRGES